jgi:hypothetical protein
VAADPRVEQMLADAKNGLLGIARLERALDAEPPTDVSQVEPGGLLVKSSQAQVHAKLPKWRHPNTGRFLPHPNHGPTTHTPQAAPAIVKSDGLNLFTWRKP